MKRCAMLWAWTCSTPSQSAPSPSRNRTTWPAASSPHSLEDRQDGLLNLKGGQSRGSVFAVWACGRFRGPAPGSPNRSPHDPPGHPVYNHSVGPNQQLGRTLVILGAVLVAAGALLYFSGKLPFRLGRLPGDIVHRGQNGTFYFPLVSCLVISVFLTLILWIINQFRR